MLYRTDKPIEIKDPCEGCKTKENGGCSYELDRLACFSHVKYESQKAVLSLLTTVYTSGMMKPEEIREILDKEYPAYRSLTNDEMMTILKRVAAAQYALDQAERQQEREKIVQEIKLIHNGLNEGYSNSPAGDKCFRQDIWRLLEIFEQQILGGLK